MQKLLKDLPKEQGELVKDIVPSQVTISGIQRVLQLLLAERISIRDLSTILEGIADALAFSRNPATMVEHVRARLARQICAQNTSGNGYLPLIALSARWEQAFAESLIGQGEERSLAMQPSKLSEFMTVVRDRFEQAAREGEAPVLVTSAAIRPFVRSLVERFRAQTIVLVAGGNPSAGAAEDGRKRLIAGQFEAPNGGHFRHRQAISWLPPIGTILRCGKRQKNNLLK